MPKSTLLSSEFTRRMNRINSGRGKYISPPEVDSYLNEALSIYFENRVALYKTSLLAKQELGVLEEKHKSFSVSAFDDRSVYADMPEDFYKLLRVEAKIQCDGCPEIYARVHEVTNHKVSEALTDPNWEPSYNYAETFCERVGNKIIVYHKGNFTVNNIYVDYVRKPKPIYTPSLSLNGSYVDGSGDVISQDSDCELDNYRKIVDIACLVASRDLTDSEEFQSQLAKILQTETVYIN